MLRYIDECCSNEARVILEAESMRLDLYYAQMVKGAIANSSINRGVVWTSSELVDVTDDVSSKLDDILPKVAMQILESIRPKEFYSREFIDYGSGSGGGNKRMVSGRDVLGVVQRLKDMKVAITDVWSQSRRFRVSDEVHMVELEVLHRLKRDGLVQWFEDPEATKLTHLEICNWFRRNDLTRCPLSPPPSRAHRDASLSLSRALNRLTLTGPSSPAWSGGGCSRPGRSPRRRGGGATRGASWRTSAPWPGPRPSTSTFAGLCVSTRTP